MRYNYLIVLLIICSFLFNPSPIWAEENNVNENSIQKTVNMDFLQNIQDKLQKSWQPPDFMEEGHVRVYFKLNREGTVIDYNILDSSGDDIYDESALEAIEKAAPFDKFPEGTTKEYLLIKYSFDTIFIEEEHMNGFYELSKKYADSNPNLAIEYLDKAINSVEGNEANYFLYKRRAEIKTKIGDIASAESDYNTYKLYKERADIKRLHLLKHLAETHPTVYIYHYLAYSYEQVNDYENAIATINKAIEISEFPIRSNLKRYKKILEAKALKQN